MRRRRRRRRRHDDREHLHGEVLGDVRCSHRHEAHHSRSPQGVRAQVEQGDQDASDAGCSHSDEEGPAEAEIDTEDGGLGDTEERGDTTGTRKPLHLGITGLEEHGQSHGALRDIGHGGDREDEGSAGSGLVSDEWQLHRGKDWCRPVTTIGE